MSMTYEEHNLRIRCGDQFADWLLTNCPDWHENKQRTMLMFKAWQAARETTEAMVRDCFKVGVGQNR